MAVDTGLSVPLFNVLKYFVISIFLEAIVRTSLDNVDVFLRAFDLYHGRPVLLNRTRVDRYSVSSIILLRSLSRQLITIILACCAYSVELLLEFSSTAQENNIPISGRLDLYQPTHHACTAQQLDSDNTMDLVIEMASSCVAISEQRYTIYNVTWQRQESFAPIPLCVHTRNNILHEGDRLYNLSSYVNGSREEESLASSLRSLKKQSWEPSVNRTGYVTLLSFTNHDVKSSSSFVSEGKNYIRVVLLSQILDTDIQCVGTVFGRYGDGIMSTRVYGCFAKTLNGWNYIEAAGTSLVRADAEFVKLKPWNALISVRIGEMIYNFTSSVVDNGNLDGVQALAMLLSAGYGKDEESVNKYAVAFKHCSDYLVPQPTDVFRTQNFDKSNSEKKITVLVSKWALGIAIIWPILLVALCAALHLWGKRRKLPTNVYVEGDIGRRWLSRSNKRSSSTPDHFPDKTKQSSSIDLTERYRWFGSSKIVFLNVESGELSDGIVVGSRAVDIERDVFHLFEDVV